MESRRREDAALAQRARSAALELYGLESARARAGRELARAQASLAAATAARRSASRQLSLARGTLLVAERRLAERVLALYVAGGVDPVEVLLGSGSLDEAIERVNGLETVAEHDRAIVAGAKAARRRLGALARRLRAREADLRRLEQEAAGRTASLAEAADERRSYLAELGTKRQLGARRIAALERAAAERARAARTRDASLPAPAAEDADPPAAPPVSASAATRVAAPATGERTLTVVVTGYALEGLTASGVPVGWGVAAVDPAVIPLGTRMTIPGYGAAVAADTGGAVQGATVDVWFPSVAQALAWGRRTVTITLH